MRVAEVATRYAKALFEIGAENNQAQKYYEELLGFQKLFFENDDLKQFALSPLVVAEEKEKFLAKALEAASLSTEIKSFLLLLAQKGRLGLIHDVVRAYQNQMDESQGVVRGEVKTAHALADSDKNEVKEILKNITKSDVILDFGEDERLVAGLTAQVGSLTIDDSIQSHLNKMRDELNRSVN